MANAASATETGFVGADVAWQRSWSHRGDLIEHVLAGI
jgi:hypothetical protein